MKAEHRKELQTNALADSLGRIVQGFKGGVKSRPTNRTLAIWGAVLLAVGLFFGWRYYSKSSDQKLSSAWLKVDEAASVDDLLKIAEAEGSPQPTRIARFKLARVYMRRGLADFCKPESRENALNDLKEAEKLYDKLAEESKEMPILVQEALLGVGKARESLNDLDGAREAYGKLAKNYPDSVNGKAAAARLETLDKDGKKISELNKKLDEMAAPPKKN